MKKARLMLTPLEIAYADRFGELPEGTLEKHSFSTEGSALVQQRMDELWNDLKKKHEKGDMSELEAEGCPWLPT